MDVGEPHTHTHTHTNTHTHTHPRLTHTRTPTPPTGHQGEAMAMGERPPLALFSAAASARMAVGEALTNIAAADIDNIKVCFRLCVCSCVCARDCGRQGEWTGSRMPRLCFGWSVCATERRYVCTWARTAVCGLPTSAHLWRTRYTPTDSCTVAGACARTQNLSPKLHTNPNLDPNTHADKKHIGRHTHARTHPHPHTNPRTHTLTSPHRTSACLPTGWLPAVLPARTPHCTRPSPPWEWTSALSSASQSPSVCMRARACVCICALCVFCALVRVCVCARASSCSYACVCVCVCVVRSILWSLGFAFIAYTHDRSNVRVYVDAYASCSVDVRSSDFGSWPINCSPQPFANLCLISPNPKA